MINRTMLTFVLRDKQQDLEDIRSERKRYSEKLDILHDEEQAVLRTIADIEKHIADIDKGDAN